MISFEAATPLAAFTGMERNGSCVLDIVPEATAAMHPVSDTTDVMSDTYELGAYRSDSSKRRISSSQWRSAAAWS